MKLYVGNCTKQHLDLEYRVPGEDAVQFRRVKPLRLNAGTQMMIHGEAPRPVLDAILDQIRWIGIVPFDDVVRTRDFVGFVFSFDKPIPLDVLQYAFDHNDGVLFERGQQQREDAAVAAGQALEATLRTPMRSVEVEILEDSEAPKLASGTRIVSDPNLARQQPGRRRRA